jgi:hypothetical protein
MPPVENFRLQGTNITIVYKELNFRSVSLDELTGVFPEGPQPVVAKFPDVLAIQYPNGVSFQLLDRRLRLSDPSPDLSRSPLAAILEPIVAAAGQTDLVAYGYNYDVVFSLPGVDDSSAFLLDEFLRERSKVEGDLNGNLRRIKLELIYDVEDSQHSLRLEPANSDNFLKAHLNVHYAHAELVTDKGLLAERLSRHYDHFYQSLSELFA